MICSRRTPSRGTSSVLFTPKTKKTKKITFPFHDRVGQSSQRVSRTRALSASSRSTSSCRDDNTRARFTFLIQLFTTTLYENRIAVRIPRHRDDLRSQSSVAKVDEGDGDENDSRRRRTDIGHERSSHADERTKIV